MEWSPLTILLCSETSLMINYVTLFTLVTMFNLLRFIVTKKYSEAFSSFKPLKSSPMSSELYPRVNRNHRYNNMIS